jgi:hypothetical protein
MTKPCGSSIYLFERSTKLFTEFAQVWGALIDNSASGILLVVLNGGLFRS